MSWFYVDWEMFIASNRKWLNRGERGKWGKIAQNNISTFYHQTKLRKNLRNIEDSMSFERCMFHMFLACSWHSVIFVIFLGLEASIWLTLFSCILDEHRKSRQFNEFFLCRVVQETSTRSQNRQLKCIQTCIKRMSVNW